MAGNVPLEKKALQRVEQKSHFHCCEQTPNCKTSCQKQARQYTLLQGHQSSAKERELNAYSLAISVDDIQKVLVLAPSYQGILGRETSALCVDG